MTPPDISPEAVARMLDALRDSSNLWDGGATACDWGDAAADMMETLAAERDEYKKLAIAGELTARLCNIVEAERDALALRVAELEADLCEMQTDYDHENREVANWKVRAEAAEAKLAASEARVERLREAVERGMKWCDMMDGPVSRSQFVNGQATAAQQIRAALEGYKP